MDEHLLPAIKILQDLFHEFGRIRKLLTTATLDHLSQQLVDSLLSITSITTLNEMLELSRPPPTRRITQLEGPQKVVGLLEIGSNRENLMDQILHTLNSIFAQRLGNERIIRQWNTGAVYLAVSALVDEVTNGLEVGFAVGDVGLHDLEHFLGRFGEFDEDSVVDLQETKELQDFSRLWCHFIDTKELSMTLCETGIPFDTKNENKFGLSGDIKVSLLFRKTF